MPTYAPGTPSWVELSSPDTDASAAFYGALFGWQATDPGPVEETGGYRMFQLPGEQSVAGLMAIMQEGQPTAWATYITVADADETAAKVAAAGGSVVVPPMDVMEIGRMAFFGDPTGAVFGIWQPKTFEGADVVRAPGSMMWFEAMTRDGASAKDFYLSVFPWTAGKPDFEGAPENYVVWEVDGEQVAGMMTMNDEFFPPEVPPHWAVTFAVADCDATVAKARELGATITFEPMDMAIGRFAGVMDPQGASFSVMQATPM